MGMFDVSLYSDYKWNSVGSFNATDRSLITETTPSSIHAVLVSIMTHSLESEQLATDQIDACYSSLIHVAILYGTCCLLTCWRIWLLASQIWTFERHYAKVKHLVI